ncbi:helix-turn-helix domain-containing protein [Mucilaginibacter sp. X5P1]|uniref:helix-turn-helix domain-containing protein n=1 Tax=Mucilaginibacter sp. X5P1 TaxID=2723088 RepID=UPI00161CD54D|nr:helix-turn-helix transcriptional regulator [Mucilaginibacter sp. X5P1]MBB6137703.1 DNA-binding Xre family transcriptional regulator [Mucilaginibacter sp. X5P1]
MAKKDHSILKKAFGTHLKKLREKKGYSLLELDYRCELNESNISKIENGKFDIRLSTIIELSKGLEIKAKELLDFDPEK